MLTVRKINSLKKNGITSLELLAVLLLTEEEQRIDFICGEIGITRRTLEKMVDNKSLLILRKYRNEGYQGLNGAPRTKVIVRTAKASEILEELNL